MAFVCGASLLAFGGVAPAQNPAPPAKQQRADCAKAKDRKACEASVAKARAARRALCAQSGDPAKCEANASQRHRK